MTFGCDQSNFNIFQVCRSKRARCLSWVLTFLVETASVIWKSWKSTWTSRFDVHFLRLTASSSPLLPEWGKHMARNPETFLTSTHILPLHSLLFDPKSLKREEKGGGGKLRTCNKIKTHPFSQLHAKTWPTKANWRNWDLFSLSSPLLYWAGRILRYPNVHLSLQKRLSKCWPLHNCTHTGGQTLTSPRQHSLQANFHKWKLQSKFCYCQNVK